MKYKSVVFLSMICILAVFFTSFNSCQEKGEKQLLGCWTDSYEENKPDSSSQLFRSCDYSFPPSRFRFSFDLKRNGICSYFKLSPDDGHYMEDGTWQFDPGTKVLEIWNLNKVKVSAFEVLKAQNNQLFLLEL